MSLIYIINLKVCECVLVIQWTDLVRSLLDISLRGLIKISNL